MERYRSQNHLSLAVEFASWSCCKIPPGGSAATVLGYPGAVPLVLQHVSTGNASDQLLSSLEAALYSGCSSAASCGTLVSDDSSTVVRHHHHLSRQRRGAGLALDEEWKTEGLLGYQQQQLKSWVGGRAPIPDALRGDMEAVLPMVRGWTVDS